jgi:putative oxidoreductase
MVLTVFSWFDRYREHGTLFIRALFGFWLIYGTQDNVFDHERMVEFEQFIHTHGFPYATAGAYVSAYAQFICGILYVLGAATRPAAAVMIVNFLFALGIAHRATPLAANLPPLAMLAVAAFLLFHGAGPMSVDLWWSRRRE